MRLILASLLALLPLTVQAQDTETKFFTALQVCAPFDVAFETAMEKGETLLFKGAAGVMSAQDGELYSSQMFFFVNQETGNWSVVGVYGDGTACLLTNGVGFTPYVGE